VIQGQVADNQHIAAVVDNVECPGRDSAQEDLTVIVSGVGKGDIGLAGHRECGRDGE